jgi:hypothetical protein
MKFDLKYFILRTTVLSLYREAIKFTYKISDIRTRKETQEYIRYEFEVNRKIENRKKIEYLIGDARKKLNQFKETFHQAE